MEELDVQVCKQMKRDDLLDVQIDFMDQLQSYGGCELESENERSDEEDEDMRYDPAEEDDEYYQYGRDDDADNEEGEEHAKENAKQKEAEGVVHDEEFVDD